MEEKPANVDMIFKDEKNTVTTILRKKKVIGKNVLVITPGEQDIYEIINDISTMDEYNDYSVLPLHSKLTFEEIQEVIYKIDGKRIIVATNIVENSITLKGLQVVIDMGLRKKNIIDDQGRIHLITKLAAKSNIIQAAGRVGREEERGTAYILLTKKLFDGLDDFPVPEIYDTNIYFHITTLLRGDYPIEEILKEEKLKRNFNRDLIQLYSVGFISSSASPTILGTFGTLKDYSSIKLTDRGLIFTKLNLSLNCSDFLINVLLQNDVDGRYTAVIIASFINLQGGIFYKPKRKYKESAENYRTRLDEVLNKQRKWIDGHIDCIETLLDVWISDPKYSEAGLYSKSMYLLKKTVEKTCSSLEELGFEIDYEIYPLVYRKKLLLDLYSVFYDEDINTKQGKIIQYGPSDKYYKSTDGTNRFLDFPLDIFCDPNVENKEFYNKLVVMDQPIISDFAKSKLTSYTYIYSDIWINLIFPYLNISEISKIINMVIKR